MSKIRINELFPNPVKSKRGESPMDPALKYALAEWQIRQATLGIVESIAYSPPVLLFQRLVRRGETVLRADG